MLRRLNALMVVVTATLAPALAEAAVIFHAGDPLGASAMYNIDFDHGVHRTLSFTRVDVPAGEEWTVEKVGGIYGYPPSANPRGRLRIVTDLGSDDDRQIIHTETMQVTATPYTGITVNAQSVVSYAEGTLASPLTLTSGETYWISLAMMSDAGLQFSAGTFGANAINPPVQMQPAFWSFDSRPNIESDNWGFYNSNTYSPTLTLNGSIVPEPATLGLVLVVASSRLRRSRR